MSVNLRLATFGKLTAVFAAIVLLITLVPTDAKAQGWGRTFDYSGRGIGVGGHIGLGVATSDVGAGFSFGSTTKIHIWEGLYMDPGFNWWIKSGFWALSIQPAPQVMFRFRKFVVHPYAGLGPAFHITHASGGGEQVNPYTGQKIKFKGDSSTDVKFGIHWTFGAEFALNETISLYNDYKFHLIFDSPDLFNIVCGCIFYF